MTSIKEITLKEINLKSNKSQKLKTYSSFSYIFKRFFEVSIIILSLPIIFLLSLYSVYKIKKESQGSILFKQTRVGLDRKTFICLKFRSMHEDSEFNPYTQNNDSRIFPYGLIMRKYRIDELPQLWNVIKGDMHLVGPRAEWDILVKKYENAIPRYNKRHLVKPGITGLAQVSYPYGRNIDDAKKKLKYDLEYIENWSIFLEFKVAIKTVLVILGKKGI